MHETSSFPFMKKELRNGFHLPASGFIYSAAMLCFNLHFRKSSLLPLPPFLSPFPPSLYPSSLLSLSLPPFFPPPPLPLLFLLSSLLFFFPNHNEKLYLIGHVKESDEELTKVSFWWSRKTMGPVVIAELIRYWEEVWSLDLGIKSWNIFYYFLIAD